LIVIAVGAMLSRSPLVVARTNSIPAKSTGTAVERAGSICQGDEILPLNTTAIRVSLAANIGSSLTLKALDDSHVVTYGERDAGWGTAETVTVPVRRVSYTVRGASICLTFGAIAEPVEIKGIATPTVVSNSVTAPTSRLRIEYLRPGHRSWWSMVSSVARRMGIGHAPGGAWIVFLLIALMAAAAAIASWAVLRTTRSDRRAVAAFPIASITTIDVPPVSDGGSVRRSAARLGAALRRIPGAGWACALVVCLSAACWSIITPPFQAPDEPAHFAYVQQLAETGSLPTSSRSDYSEEETVALLDLHQREIRWYPEIGAISSPAEQQRLQADLNEPLARSGEGGAGVAASQPPLYYALETIPYDLGEGGTLLERLELMRLLSALLAGTTALFAYMFIREALPRAPWAWTVGGLGVAFAPLLGFMSGTVNPDVMLYAVSAALFYCLARGFRRGLTPRLAIAIGALTATGFLTKLNFVGLAPGVILGLVALALRAERTSKRTAWRSVTLAVAVAMSPVCLYILVNLLSNRPGLGEASTAIHLVGGQGSVFDEISYTWQLYLPWLPGMRHYFSDVSTIRQIWFDRWVGLYGWLDTPFPVWVYNIALVPAGLIAVLAIRALVACRTQLRRRLVELAVYLVMGAGVMTLVGADAFLNLAKHAGSYTEPRYLLPMLPLLGALLALAARGAGRRWGPAVGALIVVLFFAHDIFSQLQVIARYYG
jgi:hypothetical protein